MYDAYVTLKDWLFDLMCDAENERVGRMAEWLLVHLPETKTERELTKLLFGEDAR